MGWACNTHGRDEKCLKVLVGILEGKSYSEDLSVNGRIIV